MTFVPPHNPGGGETSPPITEEESSSSLGLSRAASPEQAGDEDSPRCCGDTRGSPLGVGALAEALPPQEESALEAAWTTA